MVAIKDITAREILGESSASLSGSTPSDASSPEKQWIWMSPDRTDGERVHKQSPQEAAFAFYEILLCTVSLPF